MTRINVTVDGVSYSDEVEPRTLLVQYLRESLGKTGTVVGCDTSNCGACTVHLDGTSVKSCNVLAVQADGHEVTTIEGLAKDGELHPVQQAFHECHALQCGYCTPGMIMQACDVLKDNPDPSEQEIREGLEGNLCRCTGYHNIVKAVQQAAGAMQRRRLAGGVLMTITEDRADTPSGEIGKARTRKEDQRLITGRTRWTDNIQLPGMLHLAMVRSPFAHATDRRRSTPTRPRPRRVSSPSSPAPTSRTSRAPSPTPGRSTPSRRPRTTCPIVVDHVACAGEIVAVVAARTAAEARDAAELVDVDYDELPAVLDLKEAVKDEVLAHPDLGTNNSAVWTLDSAAQGSGTDVEDEIAKARDDGIVIEREFRQQRLIPAFMEPRSTVCDPTGEQMTVWTSTQVPHILRFLVAATTGIPESKVRVIAPDVGGGFGGKLQTTPEEFATIAVARRLGKPCKYTETRVGVAALGPPRPRPVAEADAQRHARTAPSPASRSSCSPTSAPTSASSAAASRCSARGCSTPSTSSRPTTSPCGRC